MSDFDLSYKYTKAPTSVSDLGHDVALDPPRVGRGIHFGTCQIHLEGQLNRIFKDAPGPLSRPFISSYAPPLLHFRRTRTSLLSLFPKSETISFQNHNLLLPCTNRWSPTLPPELHGTYSHPGPCDTNTCNSRPICPHPKV